MFRLILFSGLGVPIPQTRQQPHTDIAIELPCGSSIGNRCRCHRLSSSWNYKPPSLRTEDNINNTCFQKKFNARTVATILLLH